MFPHGRWFSPGTPASSTTKTGRHDIAEILLKVALKRQKSMNQFSFLSLFLGMSLSIIGRQINATSYNNNCKSTSWS
jgi:hypothetical protein